MTNKNEIPMTHGDELKRLAAAHPGSVDRLRKTREKLAARNYEGYRWDIHGQGSSDSPFGLFTNSQDNFRNFSDLMEGGEMGLAKEVEYWKIRTGKKVGIIDYMGQGSNFGNVGADIIVAVHMEESSTDPKVITVKGDIFDQKKQTELSDQIKRLKDEGYIFPFIFFRPFGGVNRYEYNLEARRAVYEQLRGAVDMQPEEGKIFMQDSIGVQYIQNIAEAFGFQNAVRKGKYYSMLFTAYKSK